MEGGLMEEEGDGEMEIMKGEQRLTNMLQQFLTNLLKLLCTLDFNLVVNLCLFISLK